MILLTNARIFDGSGAAAFVGEVLVKDNRISAVNRSATPSRASRVLQDTSNLRAIMKDGKFHKAPVNAA
jgi:N-acyl-D-aspartate/D-glutamate deacylase